MSTSSNPPTSKGKFNVTFQQSKLNPLNKNTPFQTTSFATRKEKFLKTSKTQKNLLLPIKNKYSNAYLFEMKEQKFKEKEQKKMLSKARQKSFASLKDISKTPKSFYLTENAYEKSTKDTDVNDVVINPGPNVSLLNKIAEERAKEKMDKTNKDKGTLLTKKNAAINIGTRTSVREFIDKTREMLLMKYTTEIKKERAIRLQETYSNEIESIKDTIKSMEEAKKLFNDTFFVKFGEYVKHLSIQREEEKTIDEHLIEKIVQLKNEIVALQSRKRKIETDKANLDRWMYLQIMIKEKRLSLPRYYRTILDNSSTETFKLSFVNVILKTVSQEEFERVKSYRGKIIYPNADEFLEEFKNRENHNIGFIERYNQLCSELKELKEEKTAISLEEKATSEILEADIKIKKKSLDNLKSRNKKLNKDKLTLLGGISFQSTLSNSFGTGATKKKRGNSAESSGRPRKRIMRTRLYAKIVEVYDTCGPIRRREKEKPTYKKTHPTKEMEMLLMLGKIEKVLDMLIEKNKKYLNGPRAEELKEIQAYLEKERKIQKNHMQKEEQLKKIELLKEKIEERNKKIYFIPLRKVDSYYAIFAKKEKKKKKDNKDSMEPEFEDFMYDVNDN